MTLYRRLCIDLAEHPSPGRMISIYFISEGVKEHLMKRITGWSQTEYQAQNMFRRFLMFFTTRGRCYHTTLREIECVKITAIQFAFLKLQKKKKNKTNTTEDRTTCSDWMLMAADRFRFKGRIRQMEEILQARFASPNEKRLLNFCWPNEKKTVHSCLVFCFKTFFSV